MDYHRRILSIANKRIEFDKDENFDHWFNFVLLLFFIVCICFGFAAEATGIVRILIVLFFISLIGLFLKYKIDCRALKQYKTNLTPNQFQSANESAAILNEWIVVHNEEEYFEAIKTALWQWEGFRITSILDQNTIFINSMVNPNSRANPFSFGVNRKNLNELIKHYQLEISKEDILANSEKTLNKENE